MSKWNPVEEPFRVIHIAKSKSRALYGWQDQKVRTFATLAEAESYADTIKVSISVRIDEAMNPTEWNPRGFWKCRKEIKRSPQSPREEQA